MLPVFFKEVKKTYKKLFIGQQSKFKVIIIIYIFFYTFHVHIISQGQGVIYK